MKCDRKEESLSQRKSTPADKQAERLCTGRNYLRGLKKSVEPLLSEVEEIDYGEPETIDN